MDVKWVKIRSWHAVNPQRFRRAMCGRFTPPLGVVQYSDDLPTEKSCESCLRIIARLQDA